jgi:uncharacterized membrane protein YgcG
MASHRRWYSTILLTVFLVLLAALFTSPVRAQNKTLRWHTWDADIQINTDGTFHVREVYQIEFLGGPFTFGYRDIPIDQFEELKDFAVREDAVEYREARSEAPNTFYWTRDSENYRINWFFPSTTDQTRTFTVEYTVVGGIIISEDVGDRFFWKAVGPDHDFPIESSTVTVRMPQGHAFDTTIEPFTYGVEATCAFEAEATRATCHSDYLPAGQYFEIGLRFPHGIIPAEEPSWQASYEREQSWNDVGRPAWNVGLGALAILILIGGLGIVYLMWLFSGRDPDIGPVPSYLTEPPSDLPPGVAGTLVDEKADLQDIIATVVDLARRGVLEMEEHENKVFGITASRTFTFRKSANSDSPLRDYERLLITEMFGMREEIDLDDLNQKFYTAVPRLQKELYDETVKAGLFPLSPKAVRGRYLGMGIVGLVLAAGIGFCAGAAVPGFLAGPVDTILCPFMAMGTAAVAMMIASGSMPVKTRAGAEESAKWRAFKTYLSNTERFADLQQVTEQFDRFLPYAIAFGLERTWINKFARVPGTPTPGWYIPVGGRPYYGGMHTAGDGGAALGKDVSRGGRDLSGEAVRPAPSLDSMSDRMSGGLNAMSAGLMTMLNSTASTFTSVPASSSSGGGGGFSGGGFSGGGGGGGGGAGFG